MQSPTRLALSFVLLSSLVFATAEVRAEPDADPDPPEPQPTGVDAATPDPAATKAPSAALPPQPSAPEGSNAAACLVFNNGYDAASAATAGQLVCDEIRNQGVVLVAAGAPASRTYRVHLDRLGASTVLRVTYEEPVGTVKRARRVVLRGIEEATVAAPRVARAIVRDEGIEESQRVDNLVGEETRKYEKKPGEFLWGLGILGASLPANGLFMEPGIEFSGFYEAPRYAIGFSLRTAVATQGDGMSHMSGSVGARHFFSDGDVSPFVGGGVAIEHLRLRDSEFAREGTGLGAYAEGGVEIMRLHSSRMVFGLRVDAPFFQVKREYATSGQSDEAKWLLPVTLSATYAW